MDFTVASTEQAASPALGPRGLPGWAGPRGARAAADGGQMEPDSESEPASVEVPAGRVLRCCAAQGWRGMRGTRDRAGWPLC